jgi:uncharacterized protein YjiS (DUF1127 family)
MEAVLQQATIARVDTIQSLVATCLARLRVWRTTLALENPDDHLLRDICIHREQISSVASGLRTATSFP